MGWGKKAQKGLEKFSFGWVVMSFNNTIIIYHKQIEYCRVLAQESLKPLTLCISEVKTSPTSKPIFITVLEVCCWDERFLLIWDLCQVRLMEGRDERLQLAGNNLTQGFQDWCLYGSQRYFPEQILSSVELGGKLILSRQLCVTCLFF